MAEIDLQSKFPEMQPVKSPPTLWTVNGIGFSLYGARDVDEETGTYVKTYCLCFVFLPILALRAYRVLPASDGWYFIGREPLSGLAKTWNLFLLAVAIGVGGFFGWESYTNTPEYVARRNLADADRLAAAGEAAKAAKLYQRIADESVSQAPAAAEGVKRLLDGAAQPIAPSDAVVVLHSAAALVDRPGSTLTATKIVDRGKEFAASAATSDPAGALAVLNALVPLAKDQQKIETGRQKLLERLVAQRPDDVEFAAQLASIHAAHGNDDAAEAALAPHADRLGTSEGARVLGEIYARKGKFDEAYALLSAYANERLARLHKAEAALSNTFEGVQRAAIADLNKNAPSSFRRKYEKSSPMEQQALVRDYVTSKMKADQTLRSAQQAVAAETRVVPVALELGIVTLRRAQESADAAVKRDLLEKAEQTFLAIREHAGEADAYRLFLAQVYYWLGKQEHGRALFDQLLAAHNRGSEQLVAVSNTLRDLGDFTQSRALAEEAYHKEPDAAKKHAAAVMRALSPKDEDDRIEWLGRANPADPEVKASLSAALGAKAMAENRERDAVKHLRDAVDGYAKQPESAATLNNGALARFSLFLATGDRTEFQKGAQMLERAVTLRPSDSILMENTSSVLIESSVIDIVGDLIDLKALKGHAELDLLGHLYDDEAGRQRFIDRLGSQPDVAHALSYLDKALVLAPKRHNVYSRLRAVYSYRRDAEGLRKLLERIETVEIDVSDSADRAKEFYSGASDAKFLKELASARERALEAIRRAREGPRGATFSAAVGTLVKTGIAAGMLGQAGDLDELVKLSDEAYAAAPSLASRGTLIAALLCRADKTLAAAEPEYAALSARAQRSLGQAYLIAVALSRGGRLSGVVAENADVRRSASLIIENGRRFPAERDPWDWAMLRAIDAAEAAKVAAAVLNDPVEQLRNMTAQKLAPSSAVAAFDLYWTKLIEQKDAEGLEYLKTCAAAGTPMPFDP